MKKNILLSLSLFLIICSCNKLNDTKATLLISETYPRYCFSDRVVTVATYYSRGGNFIHKKSGELAYNYFKQLEQEGLITIDDKTEDLYFVRYRLELVDSLKTKYGISKSDELPLSEINFLEITGISQSDKEAVVRYKVRSKKTPFYTLHEIYKSKYTNVELTCLESEWEEEITLVKFDTGWKIK